MNKRINLYKKLWNSYKKSCKSYISSKTLKKPKKVKKKASRPPLGPKSDTRTTQNVLYLVKIP